MEQETIDREKLTAYLLGKLSEEEQDAVAERYFIDDELFDQLLEVKDDLIDQYVRGQLPAADRPQFESYLDKAPDGWNEVAVARAMIKIINEENGAEKPSWRQRLAAWLSQQVPALVMAAGLIALGVALILMILRVQRLSHDKELLLAQTQQRDAQRTQSLREAEQKLAEEQTRNTQSRQDLERERRLRETRAPVQSPAVLLPMIRWRLSPTALRDPGQPSEILRLDSKAKTIALVIPEKGKYTGYEVELRTEDGKGILWKDSQPNTPPIRGRQNIVFYRPAEEFSTGSHILTLTLIGDQETKTREYYFTVARL